MAFVGICGSDVSYLTKGRIGDFVVREPMICGHEASGIVREVGKNVKNFKRGKKEAFTSCLSLSDVYCDVDVVFSR